MRFRMLGSLEVWSDGGWVGISAGKWRSLLACLLLKAGQIVPTDTLIDELWGDVPPPTANNLVSIYVHRLRGVIGDSEGRVLAYRAPGYQLRIGDGETDLSRFEALVGDARAALAGGDAVTGATLLSEAEGLWRGRFLADVPRTALVDTESERAAELRLAATELRIGAALECGRHAEVVPELRSLTAGHPLREGLWLLLIRALDGAGRHAEALEAYGQARTVISDELGVDPGPELQALYAELLAADAASRVPPQRPPSCPPPDASSAPTATPVVRATPAPGGLAPGDTAPGGTSGPRASTGAEALPGERARGVGGRTQAPGVNGGPKTGEDAARRGTGHRDADGASVGAAQGMIALGEFADDTPNAVTGNAADSGDTDGLTADGAPADGPSGGVSPAEETLPQLAQLPADIEDFTGRSEEVRHLCSMLTRPDAASGPGAVRIAVVAGTAGLGKTTLAVHSAHQISDLFPDGQLYVDLSGASTQPAAPAEVLARFLRDLGVDGDKIPAGEDERAALYRTRLTGRRVLVMLDDARDAAQVWPLLPGTASCAVLVTTRNRAMALASTRLVDLNTLSDSEALELFIRLVGDGRPAAEPDATAEVLLACAGLPLAIRICAARLAARRQWKVATMASRLRDSRRRLDEMRAGDLEVRASFQVSYDALRTTRQRVDPARVFRLLGLWQGRTISLPAAAALVGAREGEVATVLERLVDVNLLESPAPDRYQLHDLLRVYAAERAEAEEPEDDRAAAIERLLWWYVATAEAAAEISSPRRYHIRFDPPSSTEPLDFGGVEDAFEWYDGERGNVVAATRQASSAGLDEVGWRLPAALFPVFNRRGNWADCATTHRIALDSARNAGNRQGEGWVEHNLGLALARMRENEGLGHLERALAIRREISDIEGESQAALNIAGAYYQLEGPQAALKHMLGCLDVVRRVGEPGDDATALSNLGRVYLELDRLDEAEECFRQVMAILSDIAEPYVEGHAMCNLGRVYLGQGRLVEADEVIREAVMMHRSVGDQVGEAEALKFLGHVQRDLGQLTDARNSWTVALRILGDLGETEQAREIETELASLAVR
ncbi:MAG: tetratricopeptide repeat protein [Nocardiopsaceae bacterium]|nr:tetratricopeptide repeat protein [Nocardiopsaceae bacterium]